MPSDCSSCLLAVFFAAMSSAVTSPVQPPSHLSLPIMLCCRELALAAANQSFQVIRGSAAAEEASPARLDSLLSSDWSELPSQPEVSFILQPVSLQPKLNCSQTRLPSSSSCLFLFSSFLCFSFPLVFFSSFAQETRRCSGEVLFFCAATWFVPCSEVAFNRVRRYEADDSNRKSGDFSFLACFLCCFFNFPSCCRCTKGAFQHAATVSQPVSIFAPESLLFFACMFYFHFDITDWFPC